MNRSILPIFQNPASPRRAVSGRLRSSCSVAVLGLAGAAAFAGPAAAACPAAVGGTITVTDNTCSPLDFGAYAPGTNLLVTNTGSILGTSGNPIGNTGGGAVGSITVDGTLRSRTGSSAVINFNASTNYTPSVGKITIGATGRVETFDLGGAPVIDLRGSTSLPPPVFDGFENNGTIDVQANAPVLNVTNGTTNGSIVNNGTSTSIQTFFSAASETINGDFDNRNAITVKNSRPDAGTAQALRFAAVTLNGSILNSGAISADNSATGFGVDLTAGTNVTGSLTNSGTISGFVTGIFSSVTTIAGGIVNGGTIAAQTTGIRFDARSNGTPTIVNAAGATISGGVNSLALLQTSGAATVENAGTLDGAVELGTLNTLNINGNAARVVGDTTGSGASAVNVNGNFTSEGNFTVPTFAVTNGRTTLLHTVTATTTSVAAPGVLQIGNNTASGHVGGDIANAGSVQFNRSDAYTYGYVIGGAGSVTQMGPGTLILTGDQAYTGGTTVSGGTLQLGDGGTTGSVVGDILNNSAVAFNRSDDYTFGAIVSGTGALTQNGPGTLILTNDNAYTGGTTVATGATLQIGNGATGSLVGNIANGGAVAFNRSNDYTYRGVIGGAGTMTQNGPGLLILTGNNTYVGLTTIAAGTLQIGDGGATGGVASDIFNNSALVFNRAGVLAYDRVISGSGSVEQKGPGTLILSAAQTYGGGTRVSAGTLKLTGSIVSPATVDSGAIFNNEGLVDSTIANNGTLNLDGNAARVTGAVTGTGVVNVNGTFTSENTFAASAFNVNGGALFNMNNSIAAPVTVATGGELRLMSAQTVDGNILNNGTIDVSGLPLTTTGVYTQTAGATFKTDINYIGPGGYGQLKSARALDVADGAILFASFASSQKYANGTIVEDVLQGSGTPTKAGKITLVTQGQPIDSRYYWSAVWDGANVDLVLTVDESARPAETVRTVNLNKSLALGLMHQRYAMLRVVMDYDCAQFDKYGVCLSMQARATGFGAQATGSGVFNIAYRFADKFRIGAFIDYQASTNSPYVTGLAFERAQAHDNYPTFGGYAGYSESGYSEQALNKGLQVFVSGGMNPGKITMTRAMLTDALGYVDAQPGSGTARLDTWFVKGMAGYGIDISPNVRFMPYAGLRYTDVTRGGYVEGYNALVTQPLAYDPYYERLITGFAGAQLSTMATSRLGAHIGLGAEVDFKRSASAFSGVSTIPGLPAFGLDHGGSWNGARPAANAGAFYIVAPNQRIFLNGATGQQAFSSRTFASGMLGYLVAF